MWLTPAAHAASLLVLGDSLSAAYGIDRDQGWVSLLQRRIETQHEGIEVVNASISGETTAGGRARIDGLVRRHRPDIVIVELGGNDGLRGQDLVSVEANLRAIVARAKGSGARVLLLGIDVPTSLGPDYSRDFAALYERVAAAESVPLVPHFLSGVGGVPELTLEDGLHPTPAGHRLLAQNLLPALRTELEALSKP